MSEISVRIDGVAGRITLERPKALNAVTYDMVRAIDAAIDAWRDDPAVQLIVIDALGDKAFSAGGDIADLYATGVAGDFAYGQKFWRDEYRMNAKIAGYAKPIVSFLQGFTMGGGMGVGCHGSHRIVGETSQIAMPECGIGLVPDVGGSLILANAPGHLGAYLGTTGARMGPGDAILAGFADFFLPEDAWEAQKKVLCETGNLDLLTAAMEPAPMAFLDAYLTEIDAFFANASLTGIITSLRASQTEFAAKTLKSFSRGSPLAMACAIEMGHRLKGETDLRVALELEYRFTSRAMEHGDFIEGIRAAIIDKDRAPKWRHTLEALPQDAIETMLAPMGGKTLTF